MTYYIEYKFDPKRLKIILKPNTRYWRFRYWLNQYTAMITWWIIIPVVKLNERCERLQEGDELMRLCEIHRMGFFLKNGNVHLLKLPWWIRISKKLFTKSLKFWQGSLSFPRIYEKPEKEE
jgi:hypothetical protein